MIKTILILSILSLSIACSRDHKSSDLSDDYVLIEFAASLEEDYHKYYPQPLDNPTIENTK
jgi:hypothetical protein